MERGWRRRRDLEDLRRRRALEERGGIQRKEEDSSFGKELLEEIAHAVDWCILPFELVVLAALIFAVIYNRCGC